MSDRSAIEWTDATWNPVTGCSKVSPGCGHCYAETFAERFRGVPSHPFEQGFDLKIWPERLSLPLQWKEPRVIFVNSMSDLFHKDVPDEYVERVFEVMIQADHHVFQVLTKRSERMTKWTKRVFKNALVPDHIWLGISVENQDYVQRIHDLQQVPVKIKFLSIEPLLGPIRFKTNDLTGIRWAIVGGESGLYARPMNPEWARDIKRQCLEYDIPFFFKQWGTFNEDGERVGKKTAGRLLDGRTWDQMPEISTRQQLIFA